MWFPPHSGRWEGVRFPHQPSSLKYLTKPCNFLTSTWKYLEHLKSYFDLCQGGIFLVAFSKFPKMSKNASQLQWMLKLRCSNRLGWRLDLNWDGKKRRHSPTQLTLAQKSSVINLKEVKSLGSYDRYTRLERCAWDVKPLKLVQQRFFCMFFAMAHR